MLFTAATLDGLVDGTVTATYRRWTTVRPKVGSRFTTRAGMVEVTGITAVDAEKLGDDDAVAAGFADLSALLRWLERSARGPRDIRRVGGGRALPDRPRPGRTRSPGRAAGRRRARRDRPDRSRTPAGPDGRRRRAPGPGSVLRQIADSGRGVDGAGGGGRCGAPRFQAPGTASEGARSDREPRGRVPPVAARAGVPGRRPRTDGHLRPGLPPARLGDQRGGGHVPRAPQRARAR